MRSALNLHSLRHHRGKTSRRDFVPNPAVFNKSGLVRLDDHVHAESALIEVAVGLSLLQSRERRCG